MSTLQPPGVQLQPPEEDRSHALNWNDPPESLSRSPRPYRRRRDYADGDVNDNANRSNSHLPSPALTPSQSDTDLLHSSRPPTRSSSRLDLATPGESGAEADDEALHLVKALPAPPLKSHKGLRDAKNESLGQTKPSEAKSVPASVGTTRSKSEGDNSKRSAATQARLPQRGIELACLGALACLSWGAGTDTGKNAQLVENTQAAVKLPAYMAILTLTTFTLLLRNIGAHASQPHSVLLVLARIDPAPVLYPPMIPILIALSLSQSSNRVIAINMVLGMSTIPRRLLPSLTAPGSSTLHWALTLVPVVFLCVLGTEQSGDSTTLIPLRPNMEELRTILPEDFVLLFPLHQALFSPIRYLTNMSLLSSEQQLLSVALINMFVFAQSPQMLVMTIILWVGGLGTLYLCRPVLKWNVALERIPSWRFRRAGSVIRASQTFLGTLSEGLKNENVTENALGSDVDDEPASQDRNAAPIAKRRGRTSSSLHPPEPEKPTPEARFKAHKRRYSSTVQSYLSLTPRQVTTRKWCYALYAYLTMIAIIFIPIRLLIRDYVFQGIDPFCWAVGYLFADIPLIRTSIAQPPLSAHIPVPPLQPTAPTWHALLAQTLHHPAPTSRLTLLAYWALTVTLGVTTVLALPHVNVDTRRKVFHLTMVALLLPTGYVDPAYLSLGLVLVLTIFLMLELIRAAQLRPLSKPLARFLSPYVDGRDLRGPIVISHIFLLVGCAIPFWLSCAGLPVVEGEGPWRGWRYESRDVSMLAGVVCVGMGDAAASLVGRAIGRHKWPWPGGKSLEGSAAFAVAVTVGMTVAKAWLVYGGWKDVHPLQGGGLGDWLVVVAKAATAASAASMTEATLTGCNDNVVVPVVLWLWVRVLKL